MNPVRLTRRISAEFRSRLVLAGVVAALAAAYFAANWGADDSFGRRQNALHTTNTTAVSAAMVTGEKCIQCHGEVSHSHAMSPHGRTLTRLDSEASWREFAGRSWTRPDTGVQYEYRVEGARLMLTSSASDRSRHVTWLFGSGRHAQTPLLTWLDAAGRTASIEHSVSLYPDGSLETTLDMEAVTDTLGLPALGNYRSCSETANCFGCHSTWVPLEQDRVREDAVVPGVGCLRCHPDAAGHAEAMERGMDFPVEHPGRLSPRESVDRCGECHRRADELGGPLHPENATLARFASVGLVQSRCFLLQPHGADQPGSGRSGRLDCVSCHNPHSETAGDWKTHTTVCLGCHQASAGDRPFACPAATATDNCLNCHMPKVRAGRRLQFTNHWIHRPPAAGAGPTATQPHVTR